MGSITLFYVVLPFIILAMCHAESHSARLTAFGKSPNNNQNGPKKNILGGRTRECREDADCGGIQNTTCMTDPRDNKERCLCRDSSAPINGACPNLPRAVRSTCNNDSQCVENAECRLLANSTITSKMCLCKEGFLEKEGWCSNGFKLTSPALTILLMVTILMAWMTNQHL